MVMPPWPLPPAMQVPFSVSTNYTPSFDSQIPTVNPLICCLSLSSDFMIAMGILPVYKILTASRRTLFLDNNFTLLAYVFLMISLLSAICWLLLFNFVGRRSVGIYNIMIYAIYVLYCVLCEKQIIHSYAKDLTFDVV